MHPSLLTICQYNHRALSKRLISLPMDILRLDGSGFAALPDFDITFFLLRKDVSKLAQSVLLYYKYYTFMFFRQIKQ